MAHDRWTTHEQRHPASRASVKRGEVQIAAAERTFRKGSGFRKTWVVVGVLALALCVGNVVLLASGTREWFVWAQAITQGFLGIMFLSMLRVQHWVTNRARRSVMVHQEVNPADQGVDE